MDPGRLPRDEHPRHDFIQSQLRRVLERANERYRKAEKDFTDVALGVPSGIPSPDGTLRIRKISEERHAASEEYRKALQCYTDFVLHGIVPEDMKMPR